MFTRRSVLRMGAAFCSGSAAPSVVVSRENRGYGRRIVLLDSMEPDLEPAAIDEIVQAFLSRNIPVSCTLQLGPTPNSGLQEAQNASLARLAASEPGLFELVIPISAKLESSYRYFQMRSAGMLRASLSDTLAAVGSPKFPVVSLLDRDPDRPIDLPAFRSAGFRVLLRPGMAGEMTVRNVSGGQLTLDGGDILLPATGSDTAEKLEAALARDGDGLIVISLAGIGQGGTEEQIDAIRALATSIEDAIDGGLLFFTRPLDLVLQDAAGMRQEIALVLQGGDGISAQDNVMAFAEALDAEQISYSLLGDFRIVDGRPSADGCLPWLSVPESHPDESFVDASACRSEAEPGPASADESSSVLLSNGPDNWAWSGMRADAHFQIALGPLARPGELGLVAGGLLEDRAALITAEDVSTALQRKLLLSRLLASSRSGETGLHSVADLAAFLMPTDPVLTRLLSTRRRVVSDPPRPPRLSEEEHGVYLADARLAWSYIENFTDPKTGICAGTVQGGLARQVNREVTLWDIASQLQGILAAMSLGILPAGEAGDRVQLLAANLPADQLDGLVLPPAIFDASTRGVVRAGFDVCDTGRFLIALRAIADAGLISKVDAEALIGSWDLHAAVVNGRVHNHTSRRWVDVTTSHCTLYIAPAMESFGHSVTIPLPAIGRVPSADEAMGLLYAAAAIGPYGSEPILLEAVESGISPEAWVLAQVLFDAQLSWFEATGEFKAVSETPLNFPPWFTYQGLRVDRLGPEAWVKTSIIQNEAFRSAEFQRRIEVISAKSAYLWAAAYPHNYSDRLVSLMRQKARIEGLGFSVGVFVETEREMEHYTDLNTNGIILSAIAKIIV